MKVRSKVAEIAVLLVIALAVLLAIVATSGDPTLSDDDCYTAAREARDRGDGYRDEFDACMELKQLLEENR